MADSALQPVANALYALLNVTSLKTLATGGVTDNPAQGITFPFVWYELSEHDLSGLGAGGDLKQLELRLHVFSTRPGMVESQGVMREAIRLLQFVTPTVTGWQVPKIGRPHDVVPLPLEEINGVKCRELVSIWDIFADEVAA